MAARYDTSEYMYCSSRIRAMENRIVGKERIDRLADLRTSSDVMSELSDMGLDASANRAEREELLSSYLSEIYSEVIKMLADPSILDFLRYQYDCHNLKAAIKCFIRKTDSLGMMIPLGTLSESDIIRAVAESSWDILPTHMREAAPRAIEAYSKTSNPQQIDIIIDKACHEDMLESADDSGVGYSVMLVKTKIDLQNIVMCCRICRMGNSISDRAILNDALLDGGYLSKNDLFASSEQGEKKLLDSLGFSAYSSLTTAIAESDGSLSAFERCCDDFFMEKVKGAKFVSFGAEVAIGFVLAHEYEIKNLRIIFAGKDAELGSDTIRKRLRISYV